ncbi:hypothetical protein SCACP_21670 [Sporomusa carbonis]
MFESIIELLCDGDFSGRELARSMFFVEDLEFLAAQKEKAVH